MKNKLNFWYILLGAISIILIFLYFVKQINESIRIVSMSIGASIFGAVLLGLIIEKINSTQRMRFRYLILAPSISIAKETIDELNKMCIELRAANLVTINFENEIDFSEAAMELYLSLVGQRTVQCSNDAEYLRQTIMDIVLNSTFIVTTCKQAMYTFNEIMVSKNLLITQGYITEEEINTIEMAFERMKYFINEVDENKNLILLTNGLNFRNELGEIAGIEK